jgi:hypothetical protein
LEELRKRVSYSLQRPTTKWDRSTWHCVVFISNCQNASEARRNPLQRPDPVHLSLGREEKLRIYIGVSSFRYYISKLFPNVKKSQVHTLKRFLVWSGARR